MDIFTAHINAQVLKLVAVSAFFIAVLCWVVAEDWENVADGNSRMAGIPHHVCGHTSHSSVGAKIAEKTPESKPSGHERNA